MKSKPSCITIMPEKSNHTDLFLIRHGRTDWNAEGRFQGKIERPLDEQGLKDAERAALWLSSLDAIYSSHMLRARQTAEAISRKHQLPVAIDPELREGTYGPLDGMAKADFYDRFAKEIQIRDSLTPYERFHFRIAEGAETAAEILARVLPRLETICNKHTSQRIAIVTHGWVMRTLVIYFSNFQNDKIQIENGAILHLRGDGKGFSIETEKGVVR